MTANTNSMTARGDSSGKLQLEPGEYEFAAGIRLIVRGDGHVIVCLGDGEQEWALPESPPA
jgi:hypothetical protein